MEYYYILIVGFLFILAISLLIVGVSNDAVNFLNSAIGAKTAPFKVILIIAAAGVLAGAVFSNGMMEVARKGIFNPEVFPFSEIMVIFLAVMLTDILLLDFFNTLGLPTSTTISVVFGLLGAATLVAVYNITRDNATIHNIGSYINIENSGLIIVGIFLSVVIAFSAGLLVQWIVRLAFSFNVAGSYKYWSAVWGGFAITAILYFLVIKGAGGSSMVSSAMLGALKANTGRILVISFAGWTVLFQIMTFFTRVNILKITVLAGTFALAMAFASNDLVNFIGVPLAGFASFKDFMASGNAGSDTFLMQSLREPVNTPVFLLIGAGLIMVLTLRFSKKARSVTATTIDLSRQNEGSERFASTLLARIIVRRSMEVSNGFSRLTPSPLTAFIGRRFDIEQAGGNHQEKVAFDLVRASVNLVVASILISIGTSMKLPLSTTYVTFMVAMGTSLADGAWGRDSAVYRITGVLTVVGGWFFTALSAFFAAFLIAAFIFFGKWPAVLVLAILSVYILVKTHAFHIKKTAKEKEKENSTTIATYAVLDLCKHEVKSAVTQVAAILCNTFASFSHENLKELKKLRKESKKLAADINQIREDIPQTLRRFGESDIESGHHYVQVVTYLKEMCNSLIHVVQPAFNHVDNNHSPDKEQLQKLKEFNEQMKEFFHFVNELLEKKEDDGSVELNRRRDKLINLANDILVNRIRILKKVRKGVKVSVTYIEMLSETRNLLLNVVQLVKAHLRLVNSTTGIDAVAGEEILD